MLSQKVCHKIKDKLLYLISGENSEFLDKKGIQNGNLDIKINDFGLGYETY